jgi:hypothetical protein
LRNLATSRGQEATRQDNIAVIAARVTLSVITTGKVERFHLTLRREWLDGRVFA